MLFIIIIIINNIDFHFRALSKTLNESVIALRLEFSLTKQYLLKQRLLIKSKSQREYKPRQKNNNKYCTLLEGREPKPLSHLSSGRVPSV